MTATRAPAGPVSGLLTHVVVVPGRAGPGELAAAAARTVETLHAQRGARWCATVLAPTMAVALELQPVRHARVAITLGSTASGGGGAVRGALRATRSDRVVVLDAGDELAGADVLLRLHVEAALQADPTGTVLFTDEALPATGPDAGCHDRRKPGFAAPTAALTDVYRRLTSWPRAAALDLLAHTTHPDPAAALVGAAGDTLAFRHLAVVGVRGTRPEPVTPAGPATASSVPPAVTGGVGVVIPTAGSRREVDGRDEVLVLRALDGLLHRTDHAVAEVVVVTGDNTPAELGPQLTALDPRVRLVHVPGPFHYARAIDHGVAALSTPWTLLLNDDVEVVEPGWLGALLERAAVPGTGAVGAKLLFPDGRIQHAGVVHHADGVPYHLSIFEDDVATGVPTDRWTLAVTSPFDAVTGAAMLLRTADFDLVGGMSEAFPLNFNDADLCLKLAALGRVNALEPRAVLVHRESSSRVNVITDEENDTYRGRWAGLLRHGPLRQWQVP